MPESDRLTVKLSPALIASLKYAATEQGKFPSRLISNFISQSFGGCTEIQALYPDFIKIRRADCECRRMFLESQKSDLPQEVKDALMQVANYFYLRSSSEAKNVVQSLITSRNLKRSRLAPDGAFFIGDDESLEEIEAWVGSTCFEYSLTPEAFNWPTED